MKPNKATRKDQFNAEDFVKNLINEGATIPCDETAISFQENGNLPFFYNEVLYKKGQKFFIDNIFVLMFGKFLGLLSILAIPSIVRVLIYTNMSGTPFKAYRRYLSTVFHMCIWYQSDFTPESKLWQSITQVRNKHNSASKRCSLEGFGRISQMDMALTQFGFMGYALARRERIGLHGVDNDDLRAFVHVWRVIGFVMGIEDRFNICRESLEETSAICKQLADNVFKPAVEKKEKTFINMATNLAEGMWAMNPTLNTKVYLNIAYNILQAKDNNAKLLIELNILEKLYFQFLMFIRWTLQFKIIRIYHNYTQYMTLWLMKMFPFLAYYKYGYANSHVYVLENVNKS